VWTDEKPDFEVITKKKVKSSLELLRLFYDDDYRMSGIGFVKDRKVFLYSMMKFAGKDPHAGCTWEEDWLAK